MTRDQVHAAGGAFVASQLSKEVQKQTAESGRRPKAFLSQAEDFKLTTWMHQRTPKWGEKAVDILAEALTELNIPQLNKDHIYTRLNAHADTLPKAIEPFTAGTMEARLADLERFSILVYEFAFNGNLPSNLDNVWMSGYIAQIRTAAKAAAKAAVKSA